MTNYKETKTELLEFLDWLKYSEEIDNIFDLIDEPEEVVDKYIESNKDY